MDNTQDVQDVQEVLLHPPWKQALDLFHTTDYTYGDTIPHAWFFEAFGLEMPQPTMPNAQAERLRLLWLGNFKPFRDALLERHSMDLVSVIAEGYEVIHPSEQSKRAYQDALRETRKALTNAAQRISHVNIGMLSAPERREQADMAAKTAQLALMLRSARRLPLTSIEDEEED